MGKSSEIKVEKGKTKKDRKGRLLIQIGIIFTVIFVVIIPAFAVIHVVGNMRTYLEAKREFLSPIMKNAEEQIDKEIKNLEWYLRYWHGHEKEIRVNVIDKWDSINVDDTNLLSLIESDDVTYEQLDALSDREQLQIASYAYTIMYAYLSLSQWQMINESLFAFDIFSEKPGYVYADGGVLETVDVNLGLQLWENGDVPEPILDYIDGKNIKDQYERYEFKKDGEYYYVGYHPVVKDGKILYVIAIVHNWSDYHSTLIRNLIILIVISAALLVAAAAILLHFVNRTAVRPLRRVQDAVRTYRGDKESSAVIDKMSRITLNNELGELASDVSDLVIEIDRYNDENTKLVGEKKRVETELNLASEIQKGVLPIVFPDEKDYRLFASMNPAKEVGGDFYDFYPIDDTHVGIAIGDVSGKGVPASLFMMITKMLIKQFALAGNSAAQVLQKTNEMICAENKNNMFVTVWFGILDRTTGKITAASAGHEYPILRGSTGEFRLIKDKHGFVIGGMEGCKYKEYELELEPGSTLFLYTDGAAEATNSAEELFNTDRMLEALNKDPELQPEELWKAMDRAIDEFVGDAPQFDDLTMVCIRYNGGFEPSV